MLTPVPTARRKSEPRASKRAGRPPRARTARTTVRGVAWTRSIAPVLAAALAGCSTSPPTISVVDASITDRSADGVVVEFVLEADNDNEEPIPLREIVSTLALDDGRVIRSERLAEATVRRLGSQRFRLPIAIPLDSQRTDRSPVLGYELRGKVRWPPPGALNELLFDIEVRRPSSSFVDRGRIDLASLDRAKSAAQPRPSPPLQVP